MKMENYRIRDNGDETTSNSGQWIWNIIELETMEMKHEFFVPCHQSWRKIPEQSLDLNEMLLLIKTILCLRLQSLLC